MRTQKIFFIVMMLSVASISMTMQRLLRIFTSHKDSSARIITAPQALTYTPHFEKQRQEYYAKVLNKPWGAIARQRIASLDRQNVQWQEKMLGGASPSMSQEKQLIRTACQKESVDLCAENDSPQSISTTVKNQCDESLAEHGIPSRSIALVAYAKCDTMACSQSTIYIGKKFLRSPMPMKLWHMLNPYQIKAVALHELQHLMHDDIVNLCLAQSKVGLTNNYKCFLEQRADIMVGLYDPSYAQALAAHYLSLERVYTRMRYALKGYKSYDYERFMPRDGDPHPLARATYLMQLRDQIKAYA